MKDVDVAALLARAESTLADARRLLCPGVVAKRLGVSTRTLRRWIAEDRVHAEHTLGGHYRIRVSELARVEKIVGQMGQPGHTP